MDSDALVRAYRETLPEYETLRDAVVRHVTELLTRQGLNIHHVTGRVKRPLSLADKLRRKPGRYDTLTDVTDLVGVRVITYFADDVDVVARLMEAHHVVDWDNSMDKSRMHDPDRFGYMGVHYVLRAEPDLVPALAGTRYEVQIRSILQHAWAEIEHDLGYKNPQAVPREVRRRFYRLAGLLEMADEEFMVLHRLSGDYAATLPARLKEGPDSVFIDAQSMTYLLGVPPIHGMDLRLSGILKIPLLTGWADPERPQRIASLLHYAGVHSVGLLQKELARHTVEIERFGAEVMRRLPQLWAPIGGLRPGISVVQYVLLRACANASLDPGRVVEVLDLSGSETVEEMAGTVRAVYAEVVGKAGG
ncbi:GTP pyrophosphokinase [Deinococcus hopiensis]|uniref:PpGpp synthetase catalytic domain-containing protein (RelA/SpoT-type nucleotidyltranferase) n=1 Tax=Deinococcus hopiensis KR-140 TaxID=695939 RepID=A0A1W1VES7_9DEIO|nr:GTP pyrophosphokinase [Deinococcus hopiensis]SMB91561.1 ppGpp synthetase catalytic domain-containing protein (RelA/SpoT-type nucleotidyltranferase) [Deinococcus hopiensis KR-140]